jgi:ribA/ribD-fused uncharacterized protein
MNPTDIRTCAALCDFLEQGGQAKYVLFWGHTSPHTSAITKACFSQWFGAPFVVDGTRYLTAEHYMMAEKARLFADPVALASVLAASNPGQAKAAGRAVQNFDETVWLDKRWDIVVRANVEKFAQNGELAEFLFQTGARVLVEASPVDPVWGIGLAVDHEDAEHPNRWQGLNLLGFALMEARSQLQARVA